jgi:hypothetical protein
MYCTIIVQWHPWKKDILSKKNSTNYSYMHETNDFYCAHDRRRDSTPIDDDGSNIQIDMIAAQTTRRP